MWNMKMRCSQDFINCRTQKHMKNILRYKKVDILLLNYNERKKTNPDLDLPTNYSWKIKSFYRKQKKYGNLKTNLGAVL